MEGRKGQRRRDMGMKRTVFEGEKEPPMGYGMGRLRDEKAAKVGEWGMESAGRRVKGG
jgi:hypothetical protein